MEIAEAERRADVNAVIGGYLRDLAFAQSSRPRMFGYKRAAAAILALEIPLTELVEPDGGLPRISGIGPGSTRVIREILKSADRRRSSGRSRAATVGRISSADERCGGSS